MVMVKLVLMRLVSHQRRNAKQMMKEKRTVMAKMMLVRVVSHQRKNPK